MVLLLGAMGFVLLSVAMDVSYDPGSPQSSTSIAEAQERKTLIAELTPSKHAFSVARTTGKLKQVWIERNWGYQPHGLLDRLMDVHPTTLLPGQALVITFEGDSSIENHFVRWEFAITGGEGGSFGGASQAIWLEDSASIPTKLLVRERIRPHNSQSATVDSMTLRR